MHDPSIVLFDVRRPWPTWRSVRRRARANAGRLYFPAIVTVWHEEPGGRDAGSLCGRPARGWRLVAWTVRHWSHLRIQWCTKQSLNRWLYQKCEHCGGPSRKHNPVNVSHQWDSGPQAWGQSKPGLYHVSCSGVVNLRRELGEANDALHAMAVSALDLEMRGFSSDKAWRVTYSAEQRAKAANP